MLAQVKISFLLSSILAVALGFGIAATVQAQTTPQSDFVFLQGALVVSATESPTDAPGSQFFPAFAPAPGGTTVGGVDLYEGSVTGGTVSDSLWIQPNPAAGNQLFWYFSSDPFVSGQTDRPSSVPLITALTETGAVQDLSPFFALPPGFIQVQSDVEQTPEPGTLALLGAGAIGLLGYAWRRRNVRRSPQL